MRQQVIVRSETDVALKPLVEAALKAELRLIELGLERTRQRLRAFEERYGMTSEEFEAKFNRGELEETLDFIEWAGELRTLRLLASQKQALEGARLN